MKERVIRFSGKSINVYFTVDRCTHVAECIRGAPKVFDSTRRPWINADSEPPDKVAEVVMRCPTGSLHFKRKDNGATEPIPKTNQITVCKDGPFYIKGDLEIRNFDQTLIVKDTRIALCRCGHSSLKPLCDESHKQFDFRDRKIISTGKIEQPGRMAKMVVIVQKDGPLQIKGPVELFTPEGNLIFRGDHTTLCRCGHSDKMIFCDGSHRKIGFTTEEKIILYRSK